MIGDLFPGILSELAAAGAVVDDGDDLSRIYVRLAEHHHTALADRKGDGLAAAANSSPMRQDARNRYRAWRTRLMS